MKRLKRIQDIRLKDILARKNPYLFRAKNINFAPDFVNSILEAALSASEEGLFGNFLEELAIFINHMEFGGQKSPSRGIDLDFTRGETRYIVGIKSGPNWGNSSQYNAMRTDFKNALKVLRQSQQVGNIRAVLGICYGKAKPVDNGEYMRVEGQAFWEFISGSPNLYVDLIQPLGYEAKQHNEIYLNARELAFNRLTRELLLEFCNEAGEINWTNSFSSTAVISPNLLFLVRPRLRSNAPLGKSVHGSAYTALFSCLAGFDFQQEIWNS